MKDIKYYLKECPSSTNNFDDVIDFFGSVGLKFPSDFIDFYREFNNGAVATTDNEAFQFDAPEDYCSQNDVIFSCFNPPHLLIELYEEFASFCFPEKMVEITDSDPGSIVLSLDPRSYGQVFFCESEVLEEQLGDHDTISRVLEDFDYPNTPLPKFMFKVADSFTEFLNLVEEY